MSSTQAQKKKKKKKKGRKEKKKDDKLDQLLNYFELSLKEKFDSEDIGKRPIRSAA
jgi:hypothetical protein